MFETPVLLIVFNRPVQTKEVFASIRKRQPAFLFIAADGPRRKNSYDSQLCKSVREIVAQVDWPCKVERLFREENVGCRTSVSQAITWFFTKVNQGIILEDDCLPDQSFFTFCEELLQKYKHDENIISIGGTNLGYKFIEKQSYDFSKFMNMWGWATWKRSADLVDYNMEAWKNIRFKKFYLYQKLQDKKKALDYNWIKYWHNFFMLTAKGKMDTWDYQWIFTQLYFNKLSVFPGKNLVKNLGFTENATHTFHPGHAISILPLEKMNFPIVHPVHKRSNMVYENNYIKKIWFNYYNDSFYRILRSDFLNHPFVYKCIEIFGLKKYSDRKKSF